MSRNAQAAGSALRRNRAEPGASTMSFSLSLRITALSSIALVVACTTIPTGPSVMALPGTGKNFDQFRADDAECRAYAQYQIGGTTAQDSAVDSGVKSAVVGTAVGALAGAAMGGGHQGAGVGAGTGLIVGSMAGSGASQASGRSAQQRYDHGYVQCMYARGQKVPVSGQLGSAAMRPQYAPAPSNAPPPAGYVEPPAPSYAPPPPPPPAQQPAPARAAAGTWHYCESAKSYYPYVAKCPEGWRAVPASPPPH